MEWQKQQTTTASPANFAKINMILDCLAKFDPNAVHSVAAVGSRPVCPSAARLRLVLRQGSGRIRSAGRLSMIFKRTLILFSIVFISCTNVTIQPYRSNTLKKNASYSLAPLQYCEFQFTDDRQPTLAVTRQCFLNRNDPFFRKLIAMFPQTSIIHSSKDTSILKYEQSKTSLLIGPPEDRKLKENSPALISEISDGLSSDYMIVPVMAKGFSYSDHFIHNANFPSFSTVLGPMLRNDHGLSTNENKSAFDVVADFIDPQDVTTTFRLGIQIIDGSSNNIILEYVGVGQSKNFKSAQEKALKDLTKQTKYLLSDLFHE